MSESIDDSVQLPYCLGCGYRLTGVNHFRCPECGRAFDPDDPTSYRSASEGEPDPGEKARIEKQKTNISWLILIGLALVIVSISLLGKPSKTTPGGPAPDDGGISITTVVLVGVGVLIVGFFALWWIGGQWLMSMQERVRVLSQEQSHEKTLALLERMCSSRHPGAFIIRLWCPGYFEVGVAKQLADMDRPEEAMQWLAKSDRKCRRRRKVRRALQRNVAILLQALNDYDSDRLAEACRFDESVSNDRKLDIRVSLALDQGRLNEAASLAESEFSRATKVEQDIVRYGLSIALQYLGRFDDALGVVDVVPSGTMDIFEKPRRSDAASKKTVETDSSVEQKNRFKLDVRIMYMERVIETRHDMGEVDRAAEAIEAYARMVDRNARTQAVLAGCRATNAALRGDVESCDKWLAEYAALENDLPWRQNRADVALRRGRCHLQLGRTEQALNELSSSLETSGKPLQRHIARYWLAKAHEAAGDTELARREYDVVAAEGIDSWMAGDARDWLSRQV